MAEDPAQPLPSGPPPDPRRLRIRWRLSKLVGPGPMAFYRDACDLMDDPERFQSTTHLVAHLMREIESALRDVLVPLSGSAPAAGEDAKEGGSSHKDEIRAILAALGIPITDPVAKKWLRQAGSYHGRAHRRNLTDPAPVTDTFIQFFDDFQGILDYVLDKMEANFASVIATLDQLAIKAPATAEDVKFLLTSVPQDFVALGRFFEGIADPSWLPLLRSARLFADPPQPELHDDNTVGFAPWPQLRYLVRMATVLPDEVTEIAKAIPMTDNAAVNSGIVDIGRALPVVNAAGLVLRLAATLEARYRVGFPMRLAELIGAFSEAGDLPSALALTRSLLSFEPAEPAEPEESDLPPELVRSMREPRQRIDEHTYQSILQRHTTPLAAAIGQPVIELLAGLLEEAITVSASPEMIEEGQDFSSVWHRAIAPGGLSHDLGIKSRLTTALSQALAARAAAVPADLRPLLDLLSTRRWSIFRRLSLDLLSRSTADEPEIRIRLTDPAVFDDLQLRPEYDRLLAARFAGLDAEAQQAILALVERGPSHVDGHIEWVRQAQGREPTTEELQIYVEIWQRDRLAPLAGQLPEDWASRYEQFVADNGPPQRSDVPLFTGGPVAERSPTNAEELATLSIDDLVAYLGAFEPSPEFLGPSTGGLAQTLTNVVAADPSLYLLAARQLGDLDVEYAHGALNGIVRALTNGEALDWDRVIDLCETIVSHPRSQTPDDSTTDGWGWARLDVMRLLTSGFTGPHRPGDEHHQRIFDLIAVVARDPHPTPAEEERFGPPNMSPDDLALNSVRPRAIDAALQYGVWVYQNHPDDHFSEITSLIEQHLDPVADPSVAVRAVLGREFSNLLAFDRGWAEGAAARIFPAEEPLRRLWEAAWDAYLWRGVRNKPTWLALRDQYALAVARLTPGSEDRRDQGRDHALANHLMNLYWSGELSLDEGLLAEFFDRADDETRRLALESVGRGLAQDGPPLEPAVLDRLLALWDSRVQTAQTKPSKELSAYGWWFCSTRLPAERRFDGLRNALTLSGAAEPAHMVIEQLAALSADHPRSAAELLADMVDHETDGWRFSLWDESAATIIRNALTSPDHEARLAAQEATSRAAARGHLSWLDVQ
jgi:hypothetical protein